MNQSKLIISTNSVEEMTAEEKKDVYDKYISEKQKRMPSISGYNPKILEDIEKVRSAFNYLIGKGLIEKKVQKKSCFNEMGDNYIEYPNGNKLSYLKTKGGELWNLIYQLDINGTEKKKYI